MLPPNWVGQSWTRISASRIAAVLDLGYLSLVVLLEPNSKVKKKRRSRIGEWFCAKGRLSFLSTFVMTENRMFLTESDAFSVTRFYRLANEICNDRDGAQPV
jgi:hypothetical protein